MNDLITQIKESNLSQSSQHLTSQSLPPLHTSQSSFQYYQLLALSPQKLQQINKFVSNLERRQSSNCHFNSSTFQPNPRIVIKQKTKNYEAIKISIQYGYFICDMNIVNIDENIPLSKVYLSSSGAFGQIYKININNKQIALKCLKKVKQNFTTLFYQSIIQYFFFKVAQFLHVGPTLIKIFGFDIVLFRNSIAFSMQFCQTNLKISDEEYSLLRDKLHLLHCLRIVHLDIKNENIAFSYSLNQYVFIDYGFSRILKESIGSKTYTSFVGSPDYCSKQLRQLYLNGSSGYIDLYYNDLCCLGRLKQKNEDIDIEQQFELFYHSKAKDLQQVITILNIKYKIFIISLKGNINLQKKQHLFMDYNYHYFNDLLENVNVNLYCHLKRNKIHQKERQYEININLQKQQQLIVSHNSKNMIFRDRYIHLLSIQYRSGKSIFYLIEIHNLLDQNYIKTIDICIYKLNVIRLIKISHHILSFQIKINICKIFYSTYIKPIKSQSDITIYKEVILFIYQTSISNLPLHLEILQNIVETIILLQLITQSQLIQLSQTIILLQCNIINKLAIVFAIIAALQATHFKLKSLYDYNITIDIIFNSLSTYITSIQKGNITDKQQNLLNAFKHVIRHKTILFSNDELPINFKEYQCLQMRQLLQNMHKYIMINELINKFEEQNTYNKQYLDHIISWLNQNYLSNNTLPHIYLYLNLYYIAYYACRDKVTLKAHQYLQNAFSTLDYYSNLTPSLLQQLIKYSMSSIHTQQQNIQIYNIIKNIIKYNPLTFYRYFKYLFFINEDKISNIINISNSILQSHIQQLSIIASSNCSENHYQNYSQLHQEIYIKNKIFKKILHQQNHKYYKQFINNCYQMISQSICLLCKVRSLFQMRMIQLNIKQHKSKQSMFLQIFDMLRISIKYSKYFKRITLYLLIKLLNAWKQPSLWKKYNLHQFLYQFIKQNNMYGYCLLNSSRYPLFLSLYLHIMNYYSKQQMIQFLIKIFKPLNVGKNDYQICYLNFSLSKLLDKNKDLQFNEYHTSILQMLLKYPSIRSYYYISIYYLVFLKRERSIELQCKIIKQISYHINYLNPHTRQVIFNKYYYYFAKYIPSSRRKQYYLDCKHLKHNSRLFTLKFIIRNKVKNRIDKLMKQSIWMKGITKYLIKYHNSLQNILT